MKMAGQADQNETVQLYPVWDRSIRCFHWVNFLCVLSLAILGTIILNAKILGVGGEGKILLKTWHSYVGYVFCFNLTWRFLWAFFGGVHARWGAILPGGSGFGRKLRDYIRGFRTGNAPVYLGHNPLGRLMIAVMLLVLFSQGLTGLILAGTDLYKPPFGGAIATWVTGGDPEKLAVLRPGSKEAVDPGAYEQMRSYRHPVVTVHLYGFYLLMVLVVLHIAAMVISEVREKQGLISALFSGYKALREPPVDRP